MTQYEIHRSADSPYISYRAFFEIQEYKKPLVSQKRVKTSHQVEENEYPKK